MNKNEEKVYEVLQYITDDVRHSGWPDFLIYDKTRKFIFCVEVKMYPDKIQYNQGETHEILEAANIPVIVFYVNKYEPIKKIKERLLTSINEIYGFWDRGYYKIPLNRRIILDKTLRKQGKKLKSPIV